MLLDKRVSIVLQNDCLLKKYKTINKHRLPITFKKR